MATLSRGRTASLVILCLIVVVGVFWWRSAHKPKKGSTAPAAIAVTMTSVKQGDVAHYLSGTGSVIPSTTVTVHTRVDGQIETAAFREGQQVSKGQLLVQLDARPYRAALAQAKAQQAKDEATLANARQDLKRYETLSQQDSIPRQTLDTQRALVAQQQATIQADVAAVQSAQVQLDYTTITAPVSGRTGILLVQPGNIAHTTDTGGLVVINTVDPIQVLFTLPGEQVPDIVAALHGADEGTVSASTAASRQPARKHAVALAVQVYPRVADQADASQPSQAEPAGPAPIASGKLILLDNQISTTSGTVQVKAQFDNPDDRLWPGQYVNVRLVLGQWKGALTVPAAAVQRSAQGTYVYVVDNNQKVVKQQIVIKQFQDGLAIVTQGLQAGQKIVVDGQSKLKDGSEVKPVKSDPAAPSASSESSAAASSASSSGAAS